MEVCLCGEAEKVLEVLIELGSKNVTCVNVPLQSTRILFRIWLPLLKEA